MKKFHTLSILILTGMLLTGCSRIQKEKIVGEEIQTSDITAFYETYDRLEYPARYLRYQFYIESGKFYFLYDKREKEGYGPLTEEDRTAFGIIELPEMQWETFLQLLEQGTVQRRSDSVSSGDSGPWLYLYWNGDRGVEQVYTFASPRAQRAFEQFCESLAGVEPSAETGVAPTALSFSSFEGGQEYPEASPISRKEAARPMGRTCSFLT